MTKLKTPLSFETTFGTYIVDEQIGEGGAGRVYGGQGIDGKPIALKVLSSERVSADKRARFKNEIAFLARNKHTNIVTVIDHGISQDGKNIVPFYVMRRYQNNLRDLMHVKITPSEVLQLFGKIVDGVEAAHMQGVVHRDLKPENILCDNKGHLLAIADFGVASFTDDLVVTTVNTSPAQRLANFQYAAPEQRSPGNTITASADIYALGLILNEMFTGAVPHGTDFQSIANVAKEFAFLDGCVSKMLKQSPAERPKTISELKGLIQRDHAEFAALQRLSAINNTVIKAGEVDEPLAHNPPRLIDADWINGTLVLKLDRSVNPQWVSSLLQMGNHTSAMGAEPHQFTFNGDTARVSVRDDSVQQVVDYFKQWLPLASQKLKQLLEDEARQREAEHRRRLHIEKLAEEKRLQVKRNLKI